MAKKLKQLHLPNVRKGPNSGDIKQFVRSRLEGFELRQAERARLKAARKAARPAPREVEQTTLFPGE